MNENIILSPETLGSTGPTRRGNNNTLLGAVQRLASNVAVMEDAVMVPSRLMGVRSEVVKDMVIKDEFAEKSVDHGADLYMYFNMLKSLKSELVRGSSHYRTTNYSSDSSTSTASSGGSVSSAEDSEDEGEGQERNMETTQTLELFRMHLKGLVDIMNRLSDSSQLITSTYQKSFIDERSSTGSR